MYYMRMFVYKRGKRGRLVECKVGLIHISRERVGLFVDSAWKEGDLIYPYINKHVCIYMYECIYICI
jgi:hypothetical protein